MSAVLDHDLRGFGFSIMVNIFMGNATIIILSGMGTHRMLVSFCWKVCMFRDVGELNKMVLYSVGKTNVALYKLFSHKDN